MTIWKNKRNLDSYSRNRGKWSNLCMDSWNKIRWKRQNMMEKQEAPCKWSRNAVLREKGALAQEKSLSFANYVQKYPPPLSPRAGTWTFQGKKKITKITADYWEGNGQNETMQLNILDYWTASGLHYLFLVTRITAVNLETSYKCPNKIFILSVWLLLHLAKVFLICMNLLEL